MTQYQKKIIAAIVLLDGIGYTPASRMDIARIVYDKWIGIQFANMKRLWDGEWIVPDSEEAARMVSKGRCTCGCDRWYPTKKAIDLAATFKVGFGSMARKALAGEYPFERECEVNLPGADA